MKHRLFITLALLFGWILNFGFPATYSLALLKASHPEAQITPTPIRITAEVVISETATPFPTNTSIPIPTLTRTLRPTRTVIVVPTSTKSSVSASTPKPTQAVKAIKPSEAKPDYPANLTAICKDGTYSYSQHASGTCSGHGGVKKWINKPNK